MAERRMFAKTIIDSDAFLDMPLSTQALYFHLSMRADDEGFINNPKKIQRMIGASDDDAKLLIAKNFIIPFESGVVVIKHWRIHNYLRSDRFKPTVYREEREQLTLKENKSYTKAENVEIPTRYPDGIPNGNPDKDSIGKDSINKYGEFNNVRLSDEQLKKIKERFPKDWQDRIDELSEYMSSKGKTYKDHYATILSWARRKQKEQADKPKPIEPKKYKEFKTEDYERDDFKAEGMPQEIRDKMKGMFG